MRGMTKDQETTANSSPLLRRVCEALKNSAASECVRGKIRIEIVWSVPRQARDLYPHAHVDAADAAQTAKAHSVEAYVEQVLMTASYVDDQQAHTQQGVLFYALECFLYTLPQHQAALLYVSKLDSSGWGPKYPPKHLLPYLEAGSEVKRRLRTETTPSSSTSSTQTFDKSTSITRLLTEAFIFHFTSLSHWESTGRSPTVHHLSLHILARAQGAYLFPSSNDNQGKHVLSDGGLIKWWRSIVTSVVCRVRRLPKHQILDSRPFYIVPGYDRLESHELLPLPPSFNKNLAANVDQESPLPTGIEALAEAGWVYGYPYSLKGATSLHTPDQQLPPLPLAGPHFRAEQGDQLLDPNSIATLLPHFPDDPKSRFIAELARDAHENVGNDTSKKRPAPDTHSETPTPKHHAKDDSESSMATPPPGTPRRRGRRGRSAALSGSPSPVKLSSTQKQLMKERASLNAISADEFWQRMAFRQECCSGNAVGVFVALFTRLEYHEHQDVSQMESGNGRRFKGLHSQPLALPHNILQDIIFKRLMIDACNWSSLDASRELTRNWESALGHAIQRKGNLKEHLGVDDAERQQLLDNAADVGQGYIWDSVIMRGYSSQQLQAAEDKWKRDGEPVANGSSSITATPVNTLMVKRRKK